MNQILNLDPSDSLQINIKRGQVIPVTLNFYASDGSTPLPLTGTITMAISSTNNSGGVVKTLTSVDGLTIATNTITIQFSTSLWTFLLGDAYYYDIKNVKPDASVSYLISGFINITKNIT